MDTEAKPGVYVWLKTTHKDRREEQIIESIRTAISGEFRWLDIGVVKGTGDTTSSEDLIRSIFVLRLKTEEMSDGATASPLSINLISNAMGAVNGATGDPKRSNCRPRVMPYPPLRVTWLEGFNLQRIKTTQVVDVSGESAPVQTAESELDEMFYELKEKGRINDYSIIGPEE